MNFKKIKLIIHREFLVRVRKKSFILVTFITPILMVAMIVLPSILMSVKDEKERNIMVLDNVGIAQEVLRNKNGIHYQYAVPGTTLETVRENFESSGLYAVCTIDPLEDNYDVKIFANKQVNANISSDVANSLKSKLEQQKLEALGIPNLEEVMAAVKTDVHVKTIIWDTSGDEKESMVEIYMIIAYIASFLIYMFIFMYGSMVIRGVIEEKTTRIVEVIISSVKPIELMMGKIIGVALVAILQFVMWIVLAIVFIMVASAIAGPQMMELIGSRSSGAAEMGAIVSGNASVNAIMSTLAGLNIPVILICFLVFFVLGYLLYASMFAAIGSVSDTETETQQFQLPITLPLILGLFIMMHTFQYPDSSLSFWGSIIPFTSPMVMLARVPFGVPLWQILLSVGLLLGAFIVFAYFSAKIYRVGILMYGKKVTWKELGKWMRYKN